MVMVSFQDIPKFFIFHLVDLFGPIEAEDIGATC